MKPTLILLTVLLGVTACTAQAVTNREMASPYSLALLEQINIYRSNKGLNPLRMDPTLITLARNHSTMMFKKQQLSHNNFNERFQQADSQLCVENVGWNYPVPQEMFEGWRHSSGHNHNMLKKEVHRAGIAEVGKYVTFFACK